MKTNCAVTGKPVVRRIAGLSAGLLIAAGSMLASGLPALTSNPWDLTYGSNDTFTAFSPGSATVNSSTPGIILFGTAAPSGAQQVVELDSYTSADVCYSTTCPSTSSAYPSPNLELNLGPMVFDPYNIVAGSGITSATTDFSFYGDLTYLASSASFPSADGKPTMYTGEDPGGLTSYLYFVNADNTVSNELHVTNGKAGGAFIEAVLLDPPSSVTLDILGFADPGANSFITAAPTPEPATLPLFATAGAVLLLMRRNSRKQLS